MFFLFETSAVKNYLCLCLIHGQILHRDFVSLEFSQRIQAGIGNLDAIDRRPFVVAIGKISLGVVKQKILQKLDRSILVRRRLEHAAPGNIDVGAGSGLVGPNHTYFFHHF